MVHQALAAERPIALPPPPMECSDRPRDQNSPLQRTARTSSDRNCRRTQQILQAVATASLASLLEDEAPQATSTRGLSEPLVGKFIWRRSEWNTSLSLHFWP